MGEKEIFNLEDLNDLDTEIKSELIINNFNKKDRLILDLFSIKSTLSLDEILVGLCRKHKIVKKRTWVANRLYFLTKRKKIRRISKGLYERISEK